MDYLKIILGIVSIISFILGFVFSFLRLQKELVLVEGKEISFKPEFGLTGRKIKKIIKESQNDFEKEELRKALIYRKFTNYFMVLAFLSIIVSAFFLNN